MIVHGPVFVPYSGMVLPCCLVRTDHAVPGIVTSSADLVTCDGDRRFRAFREVWEEPVLVAAGPATASGLEPGSWLALEGGDLTGAYLDGRDGRWHDIRELFDA